MRKAIVFALATLLAATSIFASGVQEGAAEPAEPREIVWYFKEGSAQVTEDWYAVNKIEEDLGIKFVHVSPGGSDYETRLQLMLASRDVPEVITSYAALSTNLIKWGVVGPVNKYVIDEADTYIPNLKRISNNWDLGVKIMTQANGNIYGVPCTNNSSTTTSQWIRMDWLEAVGIDPPTTLEELADVFEAFTYEDPDGNGRDDTLGTMMNEFWGCNVFSIPFAARKGWYYLHDDGVILGEYHPRHKQFLAYLRDLVEAGVVSEEIPTLRFQEVKEKLQAGKFGYGWGWFGYGDEEQMREINPDAVWEPFAPVEGPAYDRGYYDAGGVIREEYLISFQESEEDYKAIFDLFEWLADDTSTDPLNPTFEGNYWIAAFGEPGVWWDVTDDGKIDVGQFDTPQSQAIKDAKEGIASWAMKRFRSKFDMAYQLALPERQANQQTLIRSFPTVYDIPDSDPNRPIRSELVAMPTELAERLAKFTSEQQIQWESMFYEVVLGVEDLDDSWDEWMRQANEAGLDELMTEVSAEMRKADLF